MSDIVIHLTSVAAASNQIVLNGSANCNPNSDPFYWQAEVAWSALAAGMNAAVKDAAIAAAADAGYTVGLLDKKTLFAGAVGL